jgi:hypothetical protein
MSAPGGDTGYSQPPNSGYVSAQPAGFPPAPPPPQYMTVQNQRRRRRVLIAVVLAIVMGAAGVILGIVGLVREPSTTPSAAPATSVPPTASAPANTEAADKSLCQAIAPLMKESADIGKSFVNLGHTGTPERDAGIPQFRAAVEDWATRIQPIVDAHANPPRYLTRTLQRYIDDTRLYAENIRPGPETDFDRSAWADRVVAYGGPFGECPKLGVQWW